MAAARCISGRTFVNNDPPTAVVVATPSRRHSNVSQSLWQLLQSLHDVFRQHVPARVMGHAMAFEYQNRGCPVVHTVFYLAFAAQVISRYVSGCNRQQEVTCRASLLRNAETLDEEWYIPTYTGAQVDYGSMGSNGNFRISGSVYHRIGPLLPVVDQPPKFAQLYLVDSEHELQNRMKLFDKDDKKDDRGMRAHILGALQTMLHNCNGCHLVRKFKEAAASADTEDGMLGLRAADGTVPRGTGNLPKFNEIAVVFPGDGSKPMRNRDIVVQLREGGEGIEDMEDVKVDPQAEPWRDIGNWRSLEDSIADFKGKNFAKTMDGVGPLASTSSGKWKFLRYNIDDSKRETIAETMDSVAPGPSICSVCS
ncbi:hypothetical protein WJX82_009513 [Trebouxia sp. C0006]